MNIQKLLKSVALGLCIAVPFVAAKAYVRSSFAPPTLSEVMAEVTGAEPFGAILAALSLHLPVESMTVGMAPFHASLRAPTPDQVAEILGRAIAQVRIDLAPRLRFATDGALVAVLNDRVALLTAVADAPDLCARLIVDGAGFGPVEGLVIPDAAGTADRLFAALAEGRWNRVARSAPTQADFDALADALAAAGLGEADLARLSRPDRADPALCASTIGVLSVLRDADFPRADRLRAEIAIALVGA